MNHSFRSLVINRDFLFFKSAVDAKFFLSDLDVLGHFWKETGLEADFTLGLVEI